MRMYNPPPISHLRLVGVGGETSRAAAVSTAISLVKFRGGYTRDGEA